MRVLITGASSMIGAALAKRLASEGIHVLAVMRHNPIKERIFDGYENIEIVHCDMQEYNTLSKLIQGEIDCAFLAAWNGTRGNERMDPAIQSDNERANMALLPELKALGCKKILTAGSQAEYGLWTSSEKLSETVLPQPNTEYGKSKLNFFELAHRYCVENRLVLIEPRFFSLYGPDDYEKTLIISVLRSMLKDAPCKMTACIQMWDYLYIDDAIDGLVTLLMQDVPGGVYNFGYGESHILKDYVESMYRATQSNSELIYGAIPYPETGMVNMNPDVSKLTSIGWRPKTNFETGVQRVIDKLKKELET